MSDGTSRPYRCKIKAPGFAHLVRCSSVSLALFVVEIAVLHKCGVTLTAAVIIVISHGRNAAERQNELLTGRQLNVALVGVVGLTSDVAIVG